MCNTATENITSADATRQVKWENKVQLGNICEIVTAMPMLTKTIIFFSVNL